MSLDRQAHTPVYRQVYERVRDAIAGGTLRGGERLPSARSLASQLATARGTIDAAYDLLATEGYIVSRGAAGTFVSPTLANVFSSKRVRAATPDPPPRTIPTLEDALQPFQMGLPALDAFPRRVWSRLATKLARDLPLGAMHLPDPFGYRPLREAIASYLAVARGVRCDPESILLTSGFQGAVGLITRVLLNRGDDVWVEDPGYPAVRRAFANAGARLAPVPVDDKGLDVAAGVARSPRARLAIVTPAHQSPLGMALDLSRRLALLAWADKAGSWIVEDDYDGEFHYDSRPLPALKSLDERDRVLYAGTFSKVLFPGLRLGYVVVPSALLEDFTRVVYSFYCDGSTFVPAIVTEFMTQGHFARHIKRMRQLYAERRVALAKALDNVFGDRLRVELQAGGMHLLGFLPNNERDVEVAERAQSRGLGPTALSPWRMESDGAQGLLLSFTNIPEQSAAREAKRLERALTHRVP
jgi:GntR family transcriptional regulator/MocR family aminotransferase